MFVETIIAVYFIIAIFLLGFGVADEMSFVNPDYKFVVVVAVLWPLFACYVTGEKLFS